MPSLGRHVDVGGFIAGIRTSLRPYLNTNKGGITLDPVVPEGRKILTALVEWADVLVGDHPTSAMEAIGISYDSLCKVNPNLIMTSITPFGEPAFPDDERLF